jgi:hypothetical protein
MGTNYYWHEKGTCEHCGRRDTGIHIGKSSAGWCFGLHVYDPKRDDYDIPSLAAWEKLWNQPGSEVLNEYGETVTPERMLFIVTDRSHPDRDWSTPDNRDFLRSNNAAPGPNGLARHTYGNVMAGDGTYDLCWYEFL